eukprot:TRINITY_DN887_c0_g1_i1.p1 TRINITY_DN887_c0_g1~~TRINITY_DN887_c0_g1_i1.p1  ORF type:complete len:246 (-),score=28.98 TRINITY_DN887_c0_g1_i1:332-1009(-)
MLIRAHFQGNIVSESVDMLPEFTMAAELYDQVRSAALARLGSKVDVVLAHSGEILPVATDLLSTFGVEPQSQIDAICSPVVGPPKLASCEPRMGPISGGTSLKLHGEGFTVGRGFSTQHLCARFGGQLVPCWRVDDSTLSCVSPPHAPGCVTISVECRGLLYGFEDALRADGATFEYVRLEAMYDLIFARTNRHCPVRMAQRQDDGDAQESGVADDSQASQNAGK